MNRRSWSDVAEYASLACFVAGSIAALASQQVAYAAVPLTLALALNLVNRHRFEQQTRLSSRSTVADVNQVVQSLNEANAELTQKTETLAQLFHSRPELEQIEGLKQAIAALPHPPKIDLSPITQSLEQLEQKTETLAQQFNSRIEPGQIEILSEANAELTQKTETLTQLFHSRPELEQIEGLKQAIAALPPPPKIDLSPITQSLEQLEQKTETLTQQFNARPETEAIAQLTHQLNALVLQFNNLPSPPEPVDLSGIEAEIATLQAQLQGIDFSPIASSIAQVKASLQTQIDHLSRQIQDLPAPFDPSTLKQQIVELERKNHSIFSDDVSSLVSVVKRLQSDSSLIQEVTSRNTCQLDALAHEFSARPETEAVAQLTNQLDALTHRLDNLPTPPKPVDLSGIQAKIKDLNAQLGSLSEQFSARPEPTAIQRLDGMIATTLQRLDELSLPTDPVDLSQLEELKTEVQQLGEKFLLTSRLAEEIEDLKQGQRELDQIRSFQQQLKDLGVSTAQEHDYTRKLSKELEQRIDQLNQVTAKLDERIQRLSETPRQLEEIKQLSVGLDERTAALYERTRNLAQMEQELELLQHLTANLDERTRHLRVYNLDEIQQQMANLRQLVNESALTTDLESVSARLSEGIASQIDTAIETQILPLSAQLHALSQQFNTRTEPQAIKKLEMMLPLAIKSLEELAVAPAPVDLSELEASITKINEALAASATKQELHALTQRFTQVIEELRCAIADLPRPPQAFDPSPLNKQIENLRQRIDSLPLTVLQQQLKDAHELIEGLDVSATALHDRTRNLAQMDQQLETVQQLTAGLDERTGHLLNRTRGWI